MHHAYVMDIFLRCMAFALDQPRVCLFGPHHVSQSSIPNDVCGTLLNMQIMLAPLWPI